MLGAALKLALATKTIVYVGYSCQDEDFVRLCKSINSQMKGLTEPVPSLVESSTPGLPLSRSGVEFEESILESSK